MSKDCFTIYEYKIKDVKSASLFIEFLSIDNIDEKLIFQVIKDKRERFEKIVDDSRILQIGNDELPLPPRKDLNVIIGVIFVFITLICAGIAVTSYIVDQRKYRLISEKRGIALRESQFSERYIMNIILFGV